MTVAEIDGLLYLPHKARRDLDRALRIPALSQGWQGSFRELLDQAQDGGTTKLAWEGLRKLRVVALDRESENVISVRLAPADGKAAAPAQPGQFLTVRLRPDPDAAPLLRTYSLSGLPSTTTYRISVKHEPHGVASGYVTTQAPSRGRDRGRRAARLVRAPARGPPGGADQRGGRGDAGAGDAARAGGRARDPPGLVPVQRPRRRSASVRRRRRARSWRSCRTRTASSATAIPGRTTVIRRTSTSPGG